MWNVNRDPAPTRPERPVLPDTAQLPPVPSSPPVPPMYGRAPVPPRPLCQSTDELPVVVVVRQPPPLISMRAPNRAGMRRLANGKGLSATGLLIAFIGWGIWAAAGRGTIETPALGFGIVLAVAVGVFAVCRLLGRFFLVRIMGRERRTARAAHAVTGLFLAACGAYYLGQTSWVQDGFDWVNQLR